MASLALFAYLLTWVEASAAGPRYAAHGGAASLAWFWVRPDRWDASAPPFAWWAPPSSSSAPGTRPRDPRIR